MMAAGGGQRPGGAAAGGGGGMGPMGWGRGPMGGMGMPVQKAKDFRGTLTRFLSYFRPMRFQLLAVLVAAVIGTVFNVVGPKVLGLATTKLFRGILAKSQGQGTVDFGYIGRILLILLVL